MEQDSQPTSVAWEAQTRPESQAVLRLRFERLAHLLLPDGGGERIVRAGLNVAAVFASEPLFRIETSEERVYLTLGSLTRRRYVLAEFDRTARRFIWQGGAWKAEVRPTLTLGRPAAERLCDTLYPICSQSLDDLADDGRHPSLQDLAGEISSSLRGRSDHLMQHRALLRGEAVWSLEWPNPVDITRDNSNPTPLALTLSVDGREQDRLAAYTRAWWLRIPAENFYLLEQHNPSLPGGLRRILREGVDENGVSGRIRYDASGCIRSPFRPAGDIVAVGQPIALGPARWIDPHRASLAFWFAAAPVEAEIARRMGEALDELARHTDPQARTVMAAIGTRSAEVHDWLASPRDAETAKRRTQALSSYPFLAGCARELLDASDDGLVSESLHAPEWDRASTSVTQRVADLFAFHETAREGVRWRSHWAHFASTTVISAAIDEGLPLAPVLTRSYQTSPAALRAAAKLSASAWGGMGLIQASGGELLIHLRDVPPDLLPGRSAAGLPPPTQQWQIFRAVHNGLVRLGGRNWLGVQHFHRHGRPFWHRQVSAESLSEVEAIADRMNSVNDMLGAFSREVVAATLYRLLQEMDPDGDPALHVRGAMLWSSPTREQADNTVTRGRNFVVLERSADEWHRLLRDIGEAKGIDPSARAGYMWDPLAPEGVWKGVRITPLCNAHVLDEEGRDMSHCVANYVTACLIDGSHILSLSTPTGHRLSTAELRVDGRSRAGVRLELVQHRARFNAAPPVECVQALDAFIKAAADGLLPIDLEGIEAGREARRAEENKYEAAQRIGYPPERLERVFRAWSFYLPREERRMHWRDWAMYHALHEVAEEIISRDNEAREGVAPEP